MSKYYYEAYGMKIRSDILFNGLLPGKFDHDCFDIDIVLGEVENINVPEKEDLLVSILYAKNDIGFQADNIGRYRVTDGRRIVVQPADCHNDLNTVIILGVCFSALMYQQGKLPFHGSSLTIGNRCVIISGDAGSGKSTLAAALIRNSGLLLADDLTLITAEGDNFIVKAGYPQQRVCRDVLERLNDDINRFKKVIGDKDKYYVPISDSFCSSPVVLDSIYVLTVEDVQKVEKEELKGISKLKTVVGNLYKKQLVNQMGIDEHIFRMCSVLCQKVPVYMIKRPIGVDTVMEQMKLLTGIKENGK